MTYAAMPLGSSATRRASAGSKRLTDFKRLRHPDRDAAAMRMFVTVHRLCADRLLPGSRAFSWPASSAACCRPSAMPRRRVMFTGYDPIRYKLTIWVISAVMCGIAGALYVPQVGIINPGEMSPAASDRDGDLGRGGRARHADRPSSSAPSSSTAARACSRSISRVLALTCWARCSSRVTLFLPQGIVGLFRRAKRGEIVTRS